MEAFSFDAHELGPEGFGIDDHGSIGRFATSQRVLDDHIKILLVLFSHGLNIAILFDQL